MLKNYTLVLAIVLLFIFTSYAGVPKLINYQGMLTDASGNRIDGTRTIHFALFGTETGGDAVWQETHTVQVKDGLFNVLLGSMTEFDDPGIDQESAYLEITVADDPPMRPRKRLVSVAFALYSDNSDHLEGHPASDFIQSVNEVFPRNGNVDLIAGSNVTITPDADNHQITIAASGEGGGTADNLGNHTATQNIRLNGHWLSNDGGDEGIEISNSGEVGIPAGLHSHGDIITSEDMQADNITIVSTAQVNGAINVGSPSASAGPGDISVEDDILVDDHVLSENITAYGGWIKTGSPSSSYGDGDIAATKNLLADDEVISGGNISCGDNLVVENHAGINMGGGYSTNYALQVNGDTYSTGDVRAGDKMYSGGHVGVNFGGYSTTYALQVSGNAYATGSWLSSDIKFKNNISAIQSPLSQLMQLRGVSYNWNKMDYPEREFTDGTQYGLIAQEVEKVFPDMVMTDENGEKAVAYYQLIPVLLEALKQQQQQIDALKQRIDQLGR